MEIKINEATRNRPLGSRVIDAPYVFANLTGYIEQLKNERAWEKNDRNGITVFKSNGMTIVVSALKKAAVLKDNIVNGFITIQILTGTVRIETPDGEVDIVENQLIAFHPNIPHSIEAKMDAVLLITTHDVKE